MGFLLELRFKSLAHGGWEGLLLVLLEGASNLCFACVKGGSVVVELGDSGDGPVCSSRVSTRCKF